MAKGLPEGYRGVEKLIKEFRTKNPKGKIQTAPVVLEDGFILITATITTDDGAVGSGMSDADVQTEKSVAKGESGAIRRALLTLGYESVEGEEDEKEEKEEKRSFKRDDEKKESKSERKADKEDDEEEEEKPRSRFGNKNSSKDSKKDDSDDSDEESDDESDEEEEGKSRFKRGSRFQRN